MPTFSLDELAAVLAAAAVLFATGFFGRAGQDTWAAARGRFARRGRSPSRRSRRRR